MRRTVIALMLGGALLLSGLFPGRVVMANNLSHNNSKDLVLGERVFKTLDDNKDGFIVKEEVRAHHQEFFKSVDRNQDGFITAHEVQLGGRSKTYFQQLDLNKDQRISFSESFALELVRFEKADSNQDGYVSYDEYMSQVRKISKN